VVPPFTDLYGPHGLSTRGGARPIKRASGTPEPAAFALVETRRGSSLASREDGTLFGPLSRAVALSRDTYREFAAKRYGSGAEAITPWLGRPARSCGSIVCTPSTTGYLKDSMATSSHTVSDDSRDETELERLDRNTTELLNEIRVAATGVQVMLAFLLVVPFNARWNRVTSFERIDYFVTLLCVSAAAALLIAPSIHYRLLFRRGEKDYLVQIGNRSAIAGGVFLALGLTGALVLLSNVLFGTVAAALVGGAMAVGLSTLWFWIPLRRRLRSPRGPRQ
jgi:hypothetical protein